MGHRRARGVRPGAGVCGATLVGLSFAPAVTLGLGTWVAQHTLQVSLPPCQVTPCAQQVTEEPGRDEFTLLDPQGLRFGLDSS